MCKFLSDKELEYIANLPNDEYNNYFPIPDGDTSDISENNDSDCDEVEIVRKNVADMDKCLQNALDDNLQQDLQVKFILIHNRYYYQYLGSLQHLGGLYHSLQFLLLHMGN